MSFLESRRRRRLLHRISSEDGKKPRQSFQKLLDMLDVDAYKGREQTYIKHFVLENYLQKLAYKVGSWVDTINYIDCFAGPWKSASEDLDDTSPFIAMKELRRARQGLQESRDQSFNIRCLFIEKDLTSFKQLKNALGKIKDIEVQALHGEFERQIDAVKSFAQKEKSFTFFFIDPTGWTGYPMDVISPLIQDRNCEVLINFMLSHINRFVDSDRPGDIPSFNRLFGSTKFRNTWKDLQGLDREDSIVYRYCEQLKRAGNFKHVTSTTILDPDRDRTYFHLIYATKSTAGLRVFRNDVERPAIQEQTRARWRAQDSKSGQMLLLPEPYGKSYSDDLIARYRTKAFDSIKHMIEIQKRVSFDDLEAQALCFPFTTSKVLKDWLIDQKEKDYLEFEGLAGKEKKPNSGKNHFIIKK